MSSREASIKKLMDYSDLGHEIFIAHSMSGAYLRSLANKCLPYIEQLAEEGYIGELNLDQLKKLIHDCDLAIIRYNDKSNYRAVHWRTLSIKFQDALKIKEKVVSGELDVEIMTKAIHAASNIMDSEYKYAKLLKTCNKALEIYRNKSYGGEIYEYFVWYGFKAYILERMTNTIRYMKDRVKDDQKTITHYTNDIRRYEAKIGRHTGVIALLTECIENPDRIEDPSRDAVHELVLVPADGSCDNCYNLDSEFPCDAQHECKGGNLNYIKKELD
jgi:hypothetical protein